MTWRLITADGVGAAAGLATDEVLCRGVGVGRVPATLRLYTYRSDCALVGRFQDLQQELHLDYCGSHGVQVNRRPTGGGAILMGRDQLGIALALSGRGEAMHGRPRQLMQRFSTGVLHGLRTLGIEAGFRGKNDIEVSGRKIAGLGIYRDASGGLLFHGSLLVDLDVGQMARVLRTPFADLGKRELRIIGRRTTTVRQQAHQSISMTEVRQAIAAGFAESFHQELRQADLDDQERAASEDLAVSKYHNDSWLRQRSGVDDRVEEAALQTSAGRLQARVSLAGKTIKSVLLQGDFFADEAAIVDLEARLRWHQTDHAAISETVREWAYATPSEDLDPVALLEVVLAATGGQADDGSKAGAAKPPYGCFVTPGNRGSQQ